VLKRYISIYFGILRRYMYLCKLTPLCAWRYWSHFIICIHDNKISEIPKIMLVYHYLINWTVHLYDKEDLSLYLYVIRRTWLHGRVLLL